ncbi:hypothetical protein [Lentzea nigeriaca]|uniref:hypothetical protein n=1 Tax=Lentzea nigeriaca TaxID=1128665 RepID=UPI00195E3B3E|nr:hypothetical protein [Lentzea nigeriaca]MBM7859175.1 hypothetical protein [Lentzea nigeriaca]
MSGDDNRMDSAEARALHMFQRSSSAHRCPAGHGALRVWPDADAPSGMCLVCTTCGHRIQVHNTSLHLSTDDEPTARTEKAPAVRLPDGTTPRGLLPDGTVRTTGWVQLGNMPIPSGFLAALIAFSAAVPLVSVAPLVPVVAPPIGYLAWKLGMRWRPASRAVNTRRVPTAALTVGQQIRLFGTAGPVGEVSTVTTGAAGHLQVRMVGGLKILRRPEQQIWQVDLRN